MAIQTRRGNYADFDPNKMVPGEWASVVQGDPNADDGRAVYMCFAAGDVKRMATYEDMVSNIEEATSEIQEAFTEGVETATQNANNAANAANEIVEEVEQKLEDGDFIGAKGETGNGINSTAVTVEYQASDSGTVIPTGAWSTTIPEVAAGSYLWTRITIPYTDGNSTVSYSVAKMGDTGPAGTVSVDTDAIVEYDTPAEYTPPASGITLKAFLGRVTRGLSNLFSAIDQKLNASQVLTEEEWDTGTVSERGYLADAKDILDEFAQLNTDLNAYNTVTISLGSVQDSGGLVFGKKGGVAQLNINVHVPGTGLVYGTDYPFTVPQGFRPKSFLFSYFIQGGSTLLYISISSNGAGFLRVPTPGTSYAGWIYQEFAYITE